MENKNVAPEGRLRALSMAAENPSAVPSISKRTVQGSFAEALRISVKPIPPFSRAANPGEPRPIGVPVAEQFAHTIGTFF
jgi:hypothetical protein